MDERVATEFADFTKRAGLDIRATELSSFARLTLPGVTAQDDPDFALVAWLSQEEALFRRIEESILGKRLQEGFLDRNGVTDVDAVIRFGCGLRNKRESRTSQALENHLEEVFGAHEIAFVRDATSENNQRPDFLFPSLEAYWSAPVSGHAGLTMLSAKPTCKEQWRPVLAEASKIPKKHLLTLEPGISRSQTDQMAKLDLQLVVPMSIQGTYTDDQQDWLWSLGDFIKDVKSRA